MPTNLLMSGPIRPDEASVLQVIASLRRQFPESRLYLSTWTESPAVRAAVDVYQVVPEPADADIRRLVTERQIQHRELNLPDTFPGGILSLYKMMYGVQCVVSLAAPFLSDSDPVLRIRTDSVIELEPAYLQSILSAPPMYLAKKGDGFDWFAFTTFGVLKRVWCFQDLQEFNREVARTWNPEALVASRVPGRQITYLDPHRTEAYILREGGRKHYYP